MKTPLAVQADRVKVFHTLDDLRKECSASGAREGLSPIDLFMAVHNFHKLIIEHLEDLCPEVEWRSMAKKTFSDALDSQARHD